MTEWNQVKLGSRRTLRLVVEGSKASIILQEGSAEIDGTELALGERTYLAGDNTYIFHTHLGCILILQGKTTQYVSSYIEDNNIANIVVNIHGCLETLRGKNKVGPRVMICGSAGYGRTQFCRTLVNYRLRMHKRILYIDAELKYKDICIPGSISAIVATQPYHIYEGWNVLDSIITFNFGHESAVKDPELYLLQLKTLSDLIEKKFQSDADLASSGFILNLDSLVDGDDSLEKSEGKAIIIRECIKYFQIDYVIVIIDEYLVRIIKRDLSPKVKIFHVLILSQSGTSFDENEMFGKILSVYFTGRGSYKIQLKTFLLDQSNFHIYRLDASILDKEDRLVEPYEMPMTVKFTNSFLAVSQAKQVKDISVMPIYGYVMVIGMVKESLKILNPAAELLPSKILIFTNIKPSTFT